MKQGYTFWIAGGDARQLTLAKLLVQDGYPVKTLALGMEPSTFGAVPVDSFQPQSRDEVLIFPLPMCSTPGILRAPLGSGPVPLAPILDAALPGQLIFGGKVDRAVQAPASARGLTIRDYLDREELAIANAVPTAEGAVQLAMEKLPVTIHRCRVLILGFGRVGRATAQRFAALGAHVTVAARRYEALSLAESMGLETIRLDRLDHLEAYPLVINTIPAPVLDRAVLERLRPGCLILDLASKPGGVDFAAAQSLGLEAVLALALPGKVAPVTAGTAIKNTICHMLTELEREVPIGT